MWECFVIIKNTQSQQSKSLAFVNTLADPYNYKQGLKVHFNASLNSENYPLSDIRFVLAENICSCGEHIQVVKLCRGLAIDSTVIVQLFDCDLVVQSDERERG